MKPTCPLATVVASPTMAAATANSTPDTALEIAISNAVSTPVIPLRQAILISGLLARES